MTDNQKMPTDTVGAKAPELSVVIPTYNRKVMLKEMLERLCHQTLSPDRFEVIVVIDGSKDGTLEMIKQLQTPYHLRAEFQDNAGKASTVFSSGVSAARNRGAGLARGRVLVFLDDDLLPLPRLLEEHLRFHSAATPTVVLGRLLPAPECKEKRGWNRWEERTFEKHYKAMSVGVRPAAGWRLYSANFSVDRKSFWDMGGFDLKMGHIRGEDVDLGIRLEKHGAKFCFANDAAAVHRGFRSSLPGATLPTSWAREMLRWPRSATCRTCCRRFTVATSGALAWSEAQSTFI